MRKIKRGIASLIAGVMLGAALGVNVSAATQQAAEKKAFQVKQLSSLEELKKILKKNGCMIDPGVEYDSWPRDREIVTEDLVNHSETAEAPSSASDHSTTNVQVEGVDEADKVKMDSRYIYTLTSNGTIAIVDTKGQMKQVASIGSQNAVGDRITKFYLNGSYLTIIFSGYGMRGEMEGQMEGGYGRIENYSGVEVYDIHDRSQPKLTRRVIVGGSLTSSRMIGQKLYLVSVRDVGYYEEEKFDPSMALPKYLDSAKGSEIASVPVGKIAYSTWSNNRYYTILTAFDTTGKQQAEINVLMSDRISSNSLYMNEKALYLTEGLYGRNPELGIEDGAHTAIIKYNILGAGFKYAACGCVQGYLLNQFSMDEYQGNLRLATMKSQEEGSNVYILNSSLSQVGKLQGIAKGEKMYSVRFEGSRGYVVTFEQIDPLFVIDLSTPKAPKILGELKVPGYSQYLHPIGEHLVVGIGYATEENVVRDENGDERVIGVANAGIKLSLFDVSDEKAPKEINHIILGEGGSYSEALDNHTAVMVDPKRHVLAIPVSLIYSEPVKITEDISSKYFKGAYVFKVENGKLVGKAKLGKIDSETGEYAQDRIGGYYSQYDDSNGRVGYIGSTMYYIYGSQINAYDMESFERIQSIKLK